MLRPDQVEALAVALLAVGQWPLERVYAALPALKAEHLLDPAYVATADLGRLTVALAKNGYNRGLLTSMYAERLRALMAALDDGALDSLPSLIVAGQTEASLRLLQGIHGVGPKVAANALKLLPV